VCSATANLVWGSHEPSRRSHKTLDSLFLTAGVPGPPPGLGHTEKWKDWLFAAGQEPDVDSLTVLGNILEEFMDVPPTDFDARAAWEQDRDRVVQCLENDGLRYYRGGRVLPNGQAPDDTATTQTSGDVSKPASIQELLLTLLKGLRRAMHPLTHRRKGSVSLSFSTEYDVQDLLHALLRPWIRDIRPEEFTPSYAGSSTRMDFLLPQHRLVIELKFVRDRSHASKIGNELIIDIDHYGRHPDCETVWCVVYDPEHLLLNGEGLVRDLEGPRLAKDRTLSVHLLVL
jgi:hypothetical protein